MRNNNPELLDILKEMQVSAKDIASQLGVSPMLVESWIEAAKGEGETVIPDEELRMLRYALMTENRRRTLF